MDFFTSNENFRIDRDEENKTKLLCLLKFLNVNGTRFHLNISSTSYRLPLNQEC